MCSFLNLLLLECALLEMCSFCVVLFLKCALFGMCSFWNVPLLEFARFRTMRTIKICRLTRLRQSAELAKPKNHSVFVLNSLIMMEESAACRLKINFKTEKYITVHCDLDYCTVWKRRFSLFYFFLKRIYTSGLSLRRPFLIVVESSNASHSSGLVFIWCKNFVYNRIDMKWKPRQVACINSKDYWFYQTCRLLLGTYLRAWAILRCLIASYGFLKNFFRDSDFRS